MYRSASLAIAVFVLAAFVQAAPFSLAAEGTHAVTGVVTDDQGRPVVGASVYGWTSDASGAQTYDKNQTGEDGAFTLHLAPGRGEITANHADHRQPVTIQLHVDGDESGLSLVLPTPPPRTAIVEGRVVDASGNPIEGAQVTLTQGCCYAYPMEDAPAKPAPTTAPTPPSPEASDANATSVSGGGSAGSAGMTRPAIWYDGDYQSATTDADGKFRFETYPGPRQLTAQAKGYAQTTLTLEAKQDQSTAADLTLEKVPAADAVLVVTVRDAATGAPIRGAGVSLQNAEWSHYAWAETGPDGKARLTTVPGWSIVNVHHYGSPEVTSEGGVAVDMIRAPSTQYYAYAKTLRLASGEQSLDAALESKPAGTVVLTGYVVDPDAQAGVPNAQVSIWNQDTGDWGSATTDATGSFRFLVRAGHYTMNVWAEKHLPGATTFTIAEDEAAKRVDVEAPRGEQKYAPCIDGCPEPMGRPGIAEMDMAAEESKTAGGPATLDAPMGAPQARSADVSSSAGADGGARGTTYQGSGGGLPPYGTASTDVDGQAADDPSRAEVPALGVGAALVLLGLLALARRR